MFFSRLCVVFLGGAALAMASSVHADEPDWTIKDGGWKSRTLPLGPLMQIRVDGRTFIAIPSRAGDGRADAKEKLSPDTLVATFDGKPISVRREMVLDRRRNAIRILDVLSNADTQERNVRVELSTSMSEGGGVRFNGVLASNGETREYGNGVPDDTSAVIVLAEQQGTPALPLFVWGQRDAKWPVSISDIGSSLRLGYEGTVPRGGKVALLHWVATTGLDKSVKPERAFDAFWKDRRLVNAMVPADIAPLLVNFKPEALTGEVPTAEEGAAGGRLAVLDALCEKIGVKRGPKDLLWLGKEEQITGSVTLEKASIEMEKEFVFKFADIAAVRGGAGRGREHRLFLRDGSVLAGRVKVVGGRLTGDVGSMTLDADALEFLVLRTQPQDGRVPPAAKGFVQTQRGEHRWLAKELPDAAFIAAFGRFKLLAADVWDVQRKREAPFCLVATLTDGSRINGVLADAMLKPDLLGQGTVAMPVAEVVHWGAAEVFAKPSKGGGGSKPDDASKPASMSRYCWLRDGSILAGGLAGEPLRLRSSSGELNVKLDDVAHLTSETADSDTTIELTNGTKLRGELLNETFEWRLGAQTVRFPVGLVSEVVRKKNDE